MKNATALAVTVAALFLIGPSVRADHSQSLDLVPRPLHIQRAAGQYLLNNDTAILIDKDMPDAANVAKQLAERLHRGTALELRVTPSEAAAPQKNTILLTNKNANAALGDEGYTLEATPDGVVIRAVAGSGLFYGTQTLLQLLPPQVFQSTKANETQTWAVPAVQIEDKPRFQWRGLHLDVSRHFFNKEEVKNYLDLMAQHKLNTFHWHLVDDQGWRIEIKKYPKLTEIGAWRDGIGFGLNPKATKSYGSDGRYGGYYTQDDIREIAAYAKDRYITIVPEIEMPGHCTAALAAYPELSCTGKAPAIQDCGGIFHGIYCAGNDASFEFLQNVLDEVISLLPDGKYIHVGGDEAEEAQNACWKKCPKCQARMKAEHLTNVHQLQSYFIRRMEKYLNGKSKTLIGWDEILEGGLAPNATVMSWRGVKGGVEAAVAGHDVVMTPNTHCYFDHYQAQSGEPKAIGGFTPLDKVYSLEPIPAELSADKAKHILGVQANLWSEYFPNYKHLQYMVYPRACALAEVSWTSPELKNWDDFSRRLKTHLQRLHAQGVNYRKP